MHATKILLVEEDEISREVLKLMLSDKFDLTVLENLDQAEQTVTSVDLQ
jgi:CheY-like chemotaxis protein